MLSLEQLFVLVQKGNLEVGEALRKSQHSYYQDLEFAKIDHHRAVRKGFPEVVYCEDKHPDHAVEIILELSQRNEQVLATRASPVLYEQLSIRSDRDTTYHELARVIQVGLPPAQERGLIGIVTAGTADIAVAEEAYVTARALGNKTQKFYDVGVAGLHRLFSHLDEIAQSNVIVVVAGMEGALASVLAGLVAKPIIGVPTAVGYGANLDGFTPLLAMLNSCATLAVMNIGNGFGAACFASLINQLADPMKEVPQQGT